MKPKYLIVSKSQSVEACYEFVTQEQLEKEYLAAPENFVPPITWVEDYGNVLNGEGEAITEPGAMMLLEIRCVIPKPKQVVTEWEL